MNPPCHKCVHFVPSRYGTIGYCGLFARFKGAKAGIRKPYSIYQFSEIIRGDPRKCGPEGKLFVGKDVLSPRVSLADLLSKDEDL